MDNFEKALKVAEESMEKLKEAFLVFKTKSTDESKTEVELSTLAAGDVFTTEIGAFKVLEQYGEETKVIQVDFARKCVQFDSDATDYKTSELRKLCDNEIYEEYAKVFGAENIVEHEVDLTTVDMQKDFGALYCKVRPLTFGEARQYNELLVNENLPDWYWTCTPWSTKARGWEYSEAVVSPRGYICRGCYNNRRGVRPVCILKSNIFVSKED